MATLFLPEDVVFQILIWVPVLSLLRLKSVCKSWYALIKSSHFIQCHATTTMDDNNSKVGGTFMTFQNFLKPEFYLLSDKGFTEVEDQSLCIKDAGMIHKARMTGSVHGIICMFNLYTRDIVLWNPATRQYRLLPKSLDVKPENWYEDRDFVGLCFDVETKDYKVIRVSSYEPRYENGPIPGRNVLRKVQIYCLSSDSWRLVDSDFHTHRCGQAIGQSLNGIYFHEGVDYTADPIVRTAILAFDLRKEKYQRVVEIPEDEDNWFELQSIDDKLACITYPYDRDIFIYKVWTLNNYGTAKESWTEIYRVNLMTPEIEIRYGCCFAGILAISFNGKFCLLKHDSLLCYNSITDEIEDLGFGEGLHLDTLTATVYKESLVPLNAEQQQLKLSPRFWVVPGSTLLSDIKKLL